MGETNLLQDLVGMEGLEGDIEDIEIGSNYPYADELQQKVPSTNTTSKGGVSNFNNKLFLQGDKQYKDFVDLEMSNIQSTEGEKEKRKKKKRKPKVVNQETVIKIIKNSLIEPYNIDPKKFDVELLIKKRKVNTALL